MSDERAILSVRELSVEFDTYGGIVQAVRGVSFDVESGKTLAIVGESGCGKSVSVQALMGLIPRPPGRITGGSVKFRGKEILGASLKSETNFRGKDISMIFQDPMTSLNPTMKIGAQITESLRLHEGLNAKQAREKAIELLAAVQIPQPKSRVDLYPFQFSGGMRQRVMIAMAIACQPSVLIADEPTTALDVTIQAQILNLLKDLQKRTGMAMILITHDLGVVAEMADDVAVMYAGQIVESGPVEDLFRRSLHPYTIGLKSAMPREVTVAGGAKTKLKPIDGSPPDLFSPPQGCGYTDRCPYAARVCQGRVPPLLEVEQGHLSRCWIHHPQAPQPLKTTLMTASYESRTGDGLGARIEGGRT